MVFAGSGSERGLKKAGKRILKRALISGITGQDGSYLAESLVASGFEVHGLVRQSSLMQRTRLDDLPVLQAARADGRLHLHYADLTDTSSLQNVVRELSPDFLYHLAGQSHIKISFDLPAPAVTDDHLAALYAGSQTEAAEEEFPIRAEQRSLYSCQPHLTN